MQRIRQATVVIAVLTAGCSGKPGVSEVAGECGNLHGAQVCTWAEMEADRVVALGATIPMRMIDSAPAEMEMAWPPVPGAELMLPEAARRDVGLTHLTVFWEAHGHPPGAFLTPHFDFHFYSISPEDRTGIDCQDVSKPASLPEGYALPDEEIPGIGLLVGVCVPQMGMHSLLKSQFEATSVFDGTMVVGYYRGNVIFTEPMIAREYLQRRQDFTLPMPQLPPREGVRYPTEFMARFDAAADAYRFTFTGFQ